MTASGRNWFEIYLLVLIVAWTSVVWFKDSDGETVAILFTRIGQQIWFAGLIISSMASLIGIALGTITGLLIERAGLFLLSGMFAWVGVAFLVLANQVDGIHLLFVSPLLLIASGVIVQRAYQIGFDIKRIKKQLSSLPPRIADSP
jgi:hypothetical protein